MPGWIAEKNRTEIINIARIFVGSIGKETHAGTYWKFGTDFAGLPTSED